MCINMKQVLTGTYANDLLATSEYKLFFVSDGSFFVTNLYLFIYVG